MGCGVGLKIDLIRCISSDKQSWIHTNNALHRIANNAGLDEADRLEPRAAGTAG